MPHQANDQESERRAEARTVLQRLREKKALILSKKGPRNLSRPAGWTNYPISKRPKQWRKGEKPNYRVPELEPEDAGDDL